MSAPLDSRGAKLFIVSSRHSGMRLDRFLAADLTDVSRSRIQELIRSGKVLVDGVEAVQPSRRLLENERVAISVEPRPAPLLRPLALAIEVLWEDDDLAAIAKPPGLVVHAGAGHAEDTLVNALLYRFGQLSSGAEPAIRPGIVHRLDRFTSGVMLVAKTDFAHTRLTEAFRSRKIHKTYTTLVHGRVEADAGRMDDPISRDLLRRTRMTTRRRCGREAHTAFRTVERFVLSAPAPAYTLLDVEIETGRTHQIRVHLSAHGYPVVGDRLYGAPSRLAGPAPLAGVAAPRIFLHAATISFPHPRSGRPLVVSAPLAEDLQGFLMEVRRAFGVVASVASRPMGALVR
jgi:23S rRNA pseudouridine1911/1915/1917 synthase